jgi:protein-S-isoprenylcysteine O-methyltransferase Ste14
MQQATEKMASLGWRAFRGIVIFMLFTAFLIFAPAWTLSYWQAWLFLAVFTLCTAATTLYFLKYDPDLVKRRMHAGPTAEREPSQKRIQLFASLALCAIFVVSALDHRFGWSSVPVAIVVLGNLAVIAGFVMIFFVFRENAFASSTVEINAGQRVISTGPYALVRHPMYAAAVVMFAGIPPALGSWWGLLTVIPLLATLILRLTDEERFLVHNLAGYEAYRRSVPHRLVPGIW